MFERGGTNRSPDRGGPTAGEQPNGIESVLSAAESVSYRLAARTRVVRETDEGEVALGQSTDGEWAVVLTDRTVYVVRADRVVDTVDYRDVRSVEATSGLLRSSLAIRTWNRGTVRVPVERGAPTEAAADFLERASDTHQRVLAALDTAREHVTALGAAIEAGDRAATDAAQAAIDEQLSLARRRIEAGPERVAAALEERVATVTTERDRTRARSHVARAKTLLEEADRLTDAEDWDAALEVYRDARDHLETAREAARGQGFDLLGAIETEIERVDERVGRLSRLPLALARDAHETARKADDLEAAVPAWAAALEHYRAALTAGWGTPVDFTGDVDDLPARVEDVATALIDARAGLAAQLRREADDCRLAGREGAAADRYRAALDQLAGARRVARELRAGDPAAIDERLQGLRARLSTVESTRESAGDDGRAGGSGSAAGGTVDILAHKPSRTTRRRG